MSPNLKWFNEIGMDDVAIVGGKNASLGEMYSQLHDKGIEVPNGFATTAEAFRQFLQQDDLAARIKSRLDALDVDDVVALAQAGREIRQWVIQTPLPETLEQSLHQAYEQLNKEANSSAVAVAIRSSATAEDLPEASFAGQQETLLNISGIDNILSGIREVFASLYNDRAIAYRVHQGFDHSLVALSAGIQHMVRSDLGASGVLFTLDTESGFRDVVFITAAYGLGETVVQGSVNPDEFVVHKPMLAKGKQAIIQRTLGSKREKMIYATERPTETIAVDEVDQLRFCLSDEEVTALARMAVTIEQHYQRPMDIEWGKDGDNGRLYILQARPETVKSRQQGRLQHFRLKQEGKVLISGRSIGQRIASGKVQVINSPSEMNKVEPGSVLVTDMTDPDWEPIMKRAAAIVTNRGGRTCHAAIIARELGIPAIVGTADATEQLKDDQPVTVSCAEGDTGLVYDGLLDFEQIETEVEEMPELPFKIMMNVANPEKAFDFQFIPNAGVGLARLEFIINRMIGIHPKALLNYADQDAETQAHIDRVSTAYASPVDFYVDKLSEGIATIAAAFWPKPVIVRLSDFKSNEYANLVGGSRYEPKEENPMIGFRGASRYLAEDYYDCFELECRSLHKVRDEMGLDNVELMIPFVRTVAEAEGVIERLAKQGLRRGEGGLRVIMMCELPSNALLAEEFLQHFDGFSIGSNDLTQLTLGLDRDSALLAESFDERNPAVKKLLHMAISTCRREGKYIGICGQGPSDHPDLARWLMEEGIESVSLNPDSVLDTWLYLAENKDA